MQEEGLCERDRVTVRACDLELDDRLRAGGDLRTSVITALVHLHDLEPVVTVGKEDEGVLVLDLVLPPESTVAFGLIVALVLLIVVLVALIVVVHDFSLLSVKTVHSHCSLP